MEHVQDIELFKSEVRRVLRPNGFLFWEVTNAKFPGNGAMNNRIDIPHTYYFEKKFFKNWFDEILIIETFSQSHNSGIVSDWSDYKTIINLIKKEIKKDKLFWADIYCK